MKVLWTLFLTFFKLGAFTFGGGYAMISLIENEVVTKKGWLTRDEMLDIITIAESTPGPLAINMATFVGTKVKGFFGALIATIGLVLPPFIIIALLSLVLDEFKSIAVISYALKGIQAGVVVLILNAFLKFFKGMEKSVISFVFLAVAFLVALLTDFSVVLIILIGAVAGVAISLISSYIARRRLGSDTSTSTHSSDTSIGDTLDDSVDIADTHADESGSSDDISLDSDTSHIDSDTNSDICDTYTIDSAVRGDSDSGAGEEEEP